MPRRKARLPVLEAGRGVRQRRRADGSWRVWWEPRPEERLAGFAAVELWPDRPDATRREAARLNAEAARVIAAGTRRGARRAERTVDALIALYRGSPHWRDTLAPKTRQSYDALLKVIAAKWGIWPVAGFDKAVVNTWFETLYAARGKRMAQALVRMLSILFNRAEVEGWRPENSNPCLRLKLPTPAPRNRRASWDEVEAVLAAAGGDPLWQVMADAALCAALHGQRATDVRLARRAGFRKVLRPGASEARWHWFLRRSKRQTDGVLPVNIDFTARLEARLARPAGPDGALFADPRSGLALTEDAFGHAWVALRAAAARACPSLLAPPLQFRDLRRSFGAWARAGGALTDDVGDVLGNSAATDPELGETYMPPSAETASRAIDAVRRPERNRERAG